MCIDDFDQTQASAAQLELLQQSVASVPQHKPTWSTLSADRDKTPYEVDIEQLAGQDSHADVAS